MNTLSDRVTETEDDISTVQGSITSLTSTVNGKASATAVTGLTQRVTSVEGTATAVEQRHFVNLDANGRVAGVELYNGTGGSSFTVNADSFKIYNGTSDISPFTVSDGNVNMSNATVTGGLDVKSASSGQRMEISNSQIKIFDASGNLRVKLGDI